MGLSIHPPLLLSFALIFLLHAPTHAIKKSYIVYMGAPPSADSSMLQLDSVTTMQYDTLGAVLGSAEKAKESMFYSYNRYFNGFAAVLEENEANEIANNPKVLSVFENKGRTLHTTRSWEFMGVENENNGQLPVDSAWKLARYGEDTIIGNLDTGVWPESKSFSDEGMGPVPTRWRGTCQTNDGVKCNRKLIGAKYFNKGYAAALGKPLKASAQTVRDYGGHGTHTLSTAGGNFVPGANVLGYGNGTAKGGSPKARVAAYKVCWTPVNGSGSCFDADIMAAFEAAISDGVDVLSVSLGGSPSEYFEDGIAIGAFHAVQHGVVVVCSAGNDGPDPGTVSNFAPWMLTVGASTFDREFTNYAALGNKNQLKGTSLSARGLPKFYPLISGAQAKAANAFAENATFCLAGTLDPKKVRGKILVCLRGGGSARVEKGLEALTAGAVGMILANDKSSGNGIVSDTHLLPATNINYVDGQLVFAYLNSTKNPTASITSVITQLGVKPAPVMASFSSRGPSLVEPGILKPDITAPGVAVIAAYTEATSPTELGYDKRRVPYDIMSGTSMSCPHISGVAGLLKTLHPDWSTAAIRSAIMTTATTQANDMKGILGSSNTKAKPFAYGAGHVQPNRAMDPGLVYDLTVNDYLNYLCGHGYNQTLLRMFSNNPYVCPESFTLTDLNYPSITVTKLPAGSMTVTRTVTNVGSPGAYKLLVNEPAGVSVSVTPITLNFKATGEKQTFTVTLKPNLKAKIKNYVFGELIWSDGNHNVRSPLVVKSSVKK